MWLQIRAYAITLIAALFVSISLYAYILSIRLDNANMRLAVIDNDSARQEENIKEVEKKVEVIKWRTQERIKYVYQYEFDSNKSDCTNAIELLRSEF